MFLFGFYLEANIFCLNFCLNIEYFNVAVNMDANAREKYMKCDDEC